jgi:uncharacterized repeat protein (TIGR01451 family)
LFEPDSNKLLVITNTGLYELRGKTEKRVFIDSSSDLLKTSAMSFYAFFRPKNPLKMNVLVTHNGFNIQEGKNNLTFLFSNISELKNDTLNLSNCQLQDDSTLVITIKSFAIVQNGARERLLVFTYKKGVISIHKNYDLSKLNYYLFATHVTKNKTIVYMYKYNLITSLENDSIITNIPVTNLKCDLVPNKLLVDNNFLWIESSSTNCQIARMRHDAYFVRGNVFYDSNKNGYKDNTEFGYSKVKLIAQPSSLQLTPDYDGNYAFKGEQGKDYTIVVADSNRFSSIIKNSYNGTIGVKLKDEKPVVNASFWLPRARCFTNRPSSFLLQNVGVLPVEKVVIRLVPDKMKILQNGSLVDTATFTYQNLGINQSASLTYDIEWPEAELTGQTATLKTITDLYINGTLASSKIDSVQTIIRCSYDPNDKSVTPAGISDKLYTLKNSTLQYQIRFENTGNDTAYHVVIRDTLNSNLDFSTFEVLGSSHKMNAVISKDGIIGFHFNYINLPDSTTDKKGAQGYVRFSIKPKSIVANNTLLCNKAAIYFDQNKPVITNSTCNLLVDKIPTNPLSIESSDFYSEKSIYPNPTNDWVYLPKDSEETTIYNLIGDQVLKSNETKVSLTVLEEGIYIVKVRAKNGKISSHKLSVVK